MKKKPEELKRESTVLERLGMVGSGQPYAKTELVRHINTLIAQHQLSQEKAAKLLGLSTYKMASFARGESTRLALETLLRALMTLGCDIDILIKRKPADQKRGHLRVRGM
ncbi:MAG: XRE family transcriptional regulator [Candidatus Hydrogenedentes bacterium]|nr:XRE family transcriptional regulator [Candidatus Hydrogenedentota bacterium]